MGVVPGRVFLNFTTIDNGRNETSRTVELVIDPEAEDPDLERGIAVSAFLSAYMATSDAVLKKYYSYTEHYEEDLVLPASGVHIEDVALLLFDLDGNPTKTATFAINAPKPTVFVATSGVGANIVDTADPAIMGLRDVMLYNSDPLIYISDGELANSLISGKRIHRASRKG